MLYRVCVFLVGCLTHSVGTNALIGWMRLRGCFFGRTSNPDRCERRGPGAAAGAAARRRRGLLDADRAGLPAAQHRVLHDGALKRRGHHSHRPQPLRPRHMAAGARLRRRAIKARPGRGAHRQRRPRRLARAQPRGDAASRFSATATGHGARSLCLLRPSCQVAAPPGTGTPRRVPVSLSDAGRTRSRCSRRLSGGLSSTPPGPRNNCQGRRR